VAADISGMPHFRSPLTITRGNRPDRGSAGHGGGHRTLATEDHYAAVCAVLWSERELLESIACTVIVEQLVANGGAARHAADTIQQASLERLAAQEVLRAAIVEALITATATSPRATLAELADEAPEPWQTILREHREALRLLASDLASLAVFDQLSLREFLA
jgi:hypothetical protein